ncbi:MAG TPA: hypothetical protein VMU89_11830 [Thermomicrobiaceae bacterium]|nr:hypothetical protein [Thermomicrobiaceae bacterium]
MVAVLVDLGGLAWADVEPLWQRWRQDTDGAAEPRPAPAGLFLLTV